MRTLTAVGSIVLLFFGVASEASAMIQVDRGIAGARIGASRSAVRAALGSPKKATSGSNDFGDFVRYTYTGGLKVLFQGRTRVTSVQLTGLGDRTSGGVGVGSKEIDAEKLAGVRCETTAGVRSCHTGSFTPGRRVTDFRITGGKVDRVTVGIVID